MKTAVDGDQSFILGVVWNWPAEPDVMLTVTELTVMAKARDGLPAIANADPLVLKRLLDAASGRPVRTLHFSGDHGIETSVWIERIGQRYALRLSSEPYRPLPANVVDLAEFRRTRRVPEPNGCGPFAA